MAALVVVAEAVVVVVPAVVGVVVTAVAVALVGSPAPTNGDLTLFITSLDAFAGLARCLEFLMDIIFLIAWPFLLLLLSPLSSTLAFSSPALSSLKGRLEFEERLSEIDLWSTTIDCSSEAEAFIVSPAVWCCCCCCC